MMSVLTTIEEIRATARAGLVEVRSEAELETWRVAVMGRKSPLMSVLRSLGEIGEEERKEAGRTANLLKTELERALEDKREALGRARIEETETAGRIDVTLPPRPLPEGRLHPVTQTQRDIVDAFVAQGFSVIEGPEVELDYYNFEALRIPADHPARELMDTFYIDRSDDADAASTLPTPLRFPERATSGLGDGPGPFPAECCGCPRPHGASRARGRVLLVRCQGPTPRFFGSNALPQRCVACLVTLF